MITYFAGMQTPVFLVAVLAKGSRANFSKAERNAMAKGTKALAESLASRRGWT